MPLAVTTQATLSTHMLGITCHFVFILQFPLGYIFQLLTCTLAAEDCYWHTMHVFIFTLVYSSAPPPATHPTTTTTVLTHLTAKAHSGC